METFDDFKIVMIVFLVSLTLCHALIFVTTNRFWRASDYIWLSLAFISLLGATSQVGQRLMGAMKFPKIENELLSSARGVHDNAKKYAESLSKDTDDPELLWATSIHEQASRMLSDVEIYLSKPISERMNASLIREPSWSQLFNRLYYGDRLDPPLKAEVKNQFAKFLHYKREIFDLTVAYVDKNAYSIVQIFVPWLLAPALALRLAKVTNELFGDRIRELRTANKANANDS